jgi:hypothetical protein
MSCLLLLLLPAPTTGGHLSDSPNSSLQKNESMIQV